MVEEIGNVRSKFYGSVQHTAAVGYAAACVRKKLFRKFWELCQPDAQTTVLDVGITCDEDCSYSNFFEEWYPYKNKITGAGIEDGRHLEKKYPGLRFQKLLPGEPLPFHDAAFDIVFSNAVLEHVGNFEAQRVFLQELLRVGKQVFLTTPNRWFPVEHHTGLPLVHFLPRSLFRRLAQCIGHDHYGQEANLNFLSRSDIKQRLLIAGQEPEIGFVYFFGWPSNIYVHGRR